MKKLIDKWVHIPGVHCGSVTLRDVMTYYGYNWSEPMCFGIGGGLGFYYSVSEEISPSHMIFVRGPEMETAFLSIVDKPTSWKHADNHVIETLKKYINEGIPVIIQTDIFYLEYYNSSTHFPGHIVSVWGYDDEAEVMFVADNHLDGLQEVPYRDFSQGMSSKEATNPLDNNFMDVKLVAPIKPLEELIPLAIRENAGKMLEGSIGGRGESGVHKIKLWSEDLPNWKYASDWKWCARFGYQVIKKRGVGGAGFRWIYRDFLKEAEEILPYLKELKLSESMNLIGNRWSDIALLLKEMSEKDNPEDKSLDSASQMAYEIWELEREFYITAFEKIETDEITTL